MVTVRDVTSDSWVSVDERHWTSILLDFSSYEVSVGPEEEETTGLTQRLVSTQSGLDL